MYTDFDVPIDAAGRLFADCLLGHVLSPSHFFLSLLRTACLYIVSAWTLGVSVWRTRRASLKYCSLAGTYTDSVLLRVDPSAAVSPNRGVLASFKHPTTPSVSDGIEGAVRRVLQDKKTEVSPNQINSLMIGSEYSN